MNAMIFFCLALLLKLIDSSRFRASLSAFIYNSNFMQSQAKLEEILKSVEFAVEVAEVPHVYKALEECKHAKLSYNEAENTSKRLESTKGRSLKELFLSR